MKAIETDEILEKIKLIKKLNSDSDLAKLLGIDKQSVYQYKKKKNADIQQKIITVLINEMES